MYLCYALTAWGYYTWSAISKMLIARSGGHLELGLIAFVDAVAGKRITDLMAWWSLQHALQCQMVKA
jgi:hypothetical protein